MPQDVKYRPRARVRYDQPERHIRKMETSRRPTEVVARHRSPASRGSRPKSSSNEHLLTHGPKIALDRPTLDRAIRVIKTPGAMNSILAIIQHSLKSYMQHNPKYFDSLKSRPGGRMIDLEQLRQAISDFRQFLALADLIGVYKQAKSHRSSRGQLSPLKNYLGWIKLAGFTTYSLFEGLEWLASKGVYKTSHHPEKQLRRNGYMLRASSWGYMLAIVAMFAEHLTSGTSRKMLKGIPEHLRTKAPHGRAYREKRAGIIRTLTSGMFWAPVCFDLGIKSQPLKKLNPIFTILAHGTNVQGAWAGAHASKVKGPGLAGTLPAAPVDPPPPPPSGKKR